MTLHDSDYPVVATFDNLVLDMTVLCFLRQGPANPVRVEIWRDLGNEDMERHEASTDLPLGLLADKPTLSIICQRFCVLYEKGRMKGRDEGREAAKREIRAALGVS